MRTELEDLKRNIKELTEGLKGKQKMISPKYFYDARGSALFSQICETEEYYLTRTEEKILRENISSIAGYIGKNVLLAEFGSGSSTKTRILLENADIRGYVPIDISEEHLMESVTYLKDIFPDIRIYPVPADYTNDFELPRTDRNYDRTIIFFPGSTIGNMEKQEAGEFLARTLKMKNNRGMIAGFDLIKDKRIIEAAYNDRGGVTAEFNLNILNNVNSLTGADFKTENFEHLAFFNEIEKRIEMHLVSRKDQLININDETIKIAEGENIITEYSHKFSLSSIRELVKGLYKVEKVWMDKNRFYALLFLVPL
jgi:dimethylhistidine N-methyltransferase